MRGEGGPFPKPAPRKDTRPVTIIASSPARHIAFALPHDTPPLTYHAMRLRWCRVAVQAFLRRWSVYLVVLGVLFSAGSVGALTSVAGLAAWVVLPLFYAVAHPEAWWLPAALAQTLLNLAVLWGLRALLWQPHWADAERALPLRRGELLRSDAIVAALALAPLFGLQAAGAAALLASGPHWLHGARGAAVATLGFVFIASLTFGVALLQKRRRAPRPRRVSGGVGTVKAEVVALTWRSALVWLPLVRGPARRTGKGLLGAGLLMCLPAVATFVCPDAAPWWLAAYLLAGLVATSRLRTLARLELEPLWQACAMLPLAPRRLARMGTWCVVGPAALGGAFLLVSLPFGTLRLPILAAYAATCVAALALIALSRPAKPAAEASRWLFFLALGLVLASEVMAA